MWDKVGVVRSGAGLAGAIAELSAIQRQASSAALRGQALVATVIAQAALERTESRGGHFRIDYPDLDPSQAYRQRRRVEPGPDRLLVVESADLEVR
jgi:L-aspartate oxidase